MHIRPSSNLQTSAGFSLTEMIVSMAVAGIMVGGMVNGFMQSAQRAEWSSYSLAAQNQALRGLEQVRAAKWDLYAYPSVDQVVSTNFPGYWDILDIPSAGGNISYATNAFTITTISTDPPLKLVRVDCVWRFMNRGLYTNSAFTYRAPDQ